ncbi:MAG: hypothetical protein IPK72_06595 [Candidatus Eisenbacteria bacterium]|nr:hypothetical protein [Candidatus Eisenbacteria bacterium]
MRSERGRRAGLWIGLLTAAGLTASAQVVGARFEAARGAVQPPPELALFPNGPWVKPATLGRARLVADLVWLKAIQYYGQHRKTDRKYPYIESLFGTLTGLDPRFENAYVLGSLILSEDLGRFDAARALLEQGIAANPESWRLAFELGFLCYMRGPDQREAAELLRLAAGKPGAPDSISRLAAYAAQKSGDRGLAVALWREVYRQNPSEEIRRLAEQYLANLGATGEDPHSTTPVGTGETPEREVP